MERTKSNLCSKLKVSFNFQKTWSTNIDLFWFVDEHEVSEYEVKLMNLDSEYLGIPVSTAALE